MANTEKEIVPGLTSTDMKQIADQVFNRTDDNHPQFNVSGNGFINILQNGKSDVSASPVFIKKINL